MFPVSMSPKPISMYDTIHETEWERGIQGISAAYMRYLSPRGIQIMLGYSMHFSQNNKNIICVCVRLRSP